MDKLIYSSKFEIVYRSILTPFKRLDWFSRTFYIDFITNVDVGDV